MTTRPSPAPSTQPEVITIGEPLIALLATAAAPLADVIGFGRHVAGAEANVAVGLARLGHQALMVGRVGADGFGTAIVRRLRGEQVDISGIKVDPGRRTGLLVRERRTLGSSEVLYFRAGSAGSALAPADVDDVEGTFAGAIWLHLSGITPALSDSAHEAVLRAIDVAHANGVRLSFDVNLRRRLWSDAAARERLGPIAADADLVFGDPDELAVVAGVAASSDGLDAAELLLAMGARAVVVKLGSEGAMLIKAEEAVIEGAMPVGRIVDPVGAGDAFCAGYLAARLEDGDARTALRWGNACAAAVLSVEGDLEGLPTRGELDGLLRDGGPDTVR